MPATRPRYADTTVCPDCRSVLPPAPFRCPTCGLPLQGFLATQLLSTLGEADDLLVRLRASTVATPATPATPTAPEPPLDPNLPPMPAARSKPVRRGLQGSSVPKILLGLGATCLLVAAVIFLAVAWTWLGVGGRTVVLVALTVITGTSGVLLGRRALSVAAEALTTVALGLVTLDIVGAEDAGWFGDIPTEVLVRLVGLGLLVTGLALSVGTRRRDRLVVPQIAAPAGLALVLATFDRTSYSVAAVDLVGLVSVLSLAGLCAIGRRLAAGVLAWVAGALAAASWAVFGLWSLGEATAHPTARQLWVEGHGWELVLMSLLSLLLWTVAWSDPLVRQACAALVASVVTFAVVLPGLDGTPTQVTALAIAVTLAWALVAATTPPSWYAVPRVPLIAGAAVVLTTALALLVDAAGAIVSVGVPFTESAAAGLAPLDQPLHPLMLIASTVTLALAGLVALPRSSRAIPLAAVAVGLSGFATLGLYPTPRWLVLTGLALIAGGLLILALRRRDEQGSLLATGAGVIGFVLVIAALPSIVLTTTSLGLVVVALVVTLILGRFPLATEVAGLGLPASARRTDLVGVASSPTSTRPCERFPRYWCSGCSPWPSIGPRSRSRRPEPVWSPPWSPSPTRRTCPSPWRSTSPWPGVW